MTSENLSWWLTPEQDRALYRELLPVRPSAAFHDPGDGPSVVLMQLEREQALWAAAHDSGEEAGAA